MARGTPLDQELILIDRLILGAWWLGRVRNMLDMWNKFGRASLVALCGVEDTEFLASNWYSLATSLVMETGLV